jgi:hypothetical protein
MPSRIPTWFLRGVEIVEESWPPQSEVPSPSNAGEAGTYGSNRSEGVSGQDEMSAESVL